MAAQNLIPAPQADLVPSAFEQAQDDGVRRERFAKNLRLFMFVDMLSDGFWLLAFVAFVAPVALAALAAPFALIMSMPSLDGPADFALRLENAPALALACVAFVVAVVWFWAAPRHAASLSCESSAHAVTFRRGFLLRKVQTVPFDRIVQITVYSGPVLRRLGVGVALIHTEAGSLNVVPAYGLADAEGFAREVLRRCDLTAKEAQEKRRAQRRQDARKRLALAEAAQAAMGAAARMAALAERRTRGRAAANQSQAGPAG